MTCGKKPKLGIKVHGGSMSGGGGGGGGGHGSQWTSIGGSIVSILVARISFPLLTVVLNVWEDGSTPQTTSQSTAATLQQLRR